MHFGLASSRLTVLINAVLRGVGLVKGRYLFQCGYPKVQCLLDSGTYWIPGIY